MKYRVLNKEDGEYTVLPLNNDANSLLRRDLFTGLVDKTGREVYENDIVRFYVGNDEYVETVKFDPETACFRFGKYSPSDSFLLLSGGIVNLTVLGI